MQAKESILKVIKEKTLEIADSARKLSRIQIAIVISLLVVLLISAGINYYKSRPVEIKIKEDSAENAKSEVKKVVVHIAGCVNNPGLYELGEGARVADALEKAGGPKPDASLDNINLAAKIEDGNQIIVPSISDQSSNASSGNSGSNIANAGGLININTAGAEELDKLPGIGPSYAERIIEYRTENGPFSSIEELDQVKGIGPKTVEEIKSLVTI